MVQFMSAKVFLYSRLSGLYFRVEYSDAERRRVSTFYWWVTVAAKQQ